VFALILCVFCTSQFCHNAKIGFTFCILCGIIGGVVGIRNGLVVSYQSRGGLGLEAMYFVAL